MTHCNLKLTSFPYDPTRLKSLYKILFQHLPFWQFVDYRQPYTNIMITACVKVFSQHFSPVSFTLDKLEKVLRGFFYSRRSCICALATSVSCKENRKPFQSEVCTNSYSRGSRSQSGFYGRKNKTQLFFLTDETFLYLFFMGFIANLFIKRNLGNYE